MRNTTLFALTLLALMEVFAAAQNLVVDVNLTMLDVFVEDEKGSPVIDLTAEDFEVIESGRIRPVKHLSFEYDAVDLGLVVDRSSSIEVVKKHLDKAVMQLLDKTGDDDRLFLMTFAGKNKLDVPWTTAREKIIQAITKAKIGYGTRLYDVVVKAIQYVSRGTGERKVLVLLTDGADHYSNHTFEQVANSAVFNGIPVYVIAYAGEDSATAFDRGWAEVQGRLTELARVTEGKAFFPSAGADCSRIAGEIAQRAHYRYRLGFYSSEPKVDLQNLHVRLRNGGSQRVSIRGTRPASFISE